MKFVSDSCFEVSHHIFILYSCDLSENPLITLQPNLKCDSPGYRLHIHLAGRINQESGKLTGITGEEVKTLIEKDGTTWYFPEHGKIRRACWKIGDAENSSKKLKSRKKC